MTDWSGEDYLNSLSGQPAARVPASIGEIWDTQWKAAGLDTITGVGQPYMDAEQDLVSAIEARTGKGIGDYAREQNIPFTAQVTQQGRLQALSALAETLPEDARKSVAPLLDVRKRAAEKAQAIEKDAADVSGATYGLSGTATAWAAGLARQAIDPANIAAMAITAPIGGEGGPVLTQIVRQAAAAGTAQAIVEPYIEPARGELGLEHGFTRAAENVGGATVGGAAITGGLIGLGRLLRMGARSAPAPRPELDLSGNRTFTGYFDPETADAFFQGVPLEDRPPVSAPSGLSFGGSRFDIAEGAQAQPTRVKLPEQPHVRSTYAPGYVDPETVAALDRGHELVSPPALGMVDAAGVGRSFDIAEGAKAGPTRVRLPDEPLRQSEYAPPHVDPETVAALDRGHEYPPVQERVFGDADQASPWAFGKISAADFEAAAKFAERDQTFDGLAPGANAADKMAHEARIGEAASAIEQGRPADHVAVVENLRADGIEAQPVAKEVVARPSSTPRYRPHSLLEFLAANGGISAKDPLAKDMLQSFGGENPFVPGFGRLVRSEGKPLDVAREAAVEAGYIADPARQSGGVSESTVNHLLDAIDTEASGQRQYPAGAEGTKTKAELAGEKESSAAARDKAVAGHAADFDARMQELKIDGVPKGLRDRSLQIMEKEGQPDPLLAYERALIEHEDRLDAKRRARNADPELHIPGWDVADEPGAASPLGGDAADGVRERPGNADAGGAPREDSGRPGSQGEGSAGAVAGDPALKADAERAIEAQAAKGAGDLEISIPDENGNVRKVSARQAMREIDDDAKAAAELKNCVGNTGGGE